jgi:hypothetical protein
MVHLAVTSIIGDESGVCRDRRHGEMCKPVIEIPVSAHLGGIAANPSPCFMPFVRGLR